VVPLAFFCTLSHVPNPHTLVKGAADDEVGLGVEVDAKDIARVALQRAQAAPLGGQGHALGAAWVGVGVRAAYGGNVPYFDGLVIRARAQVLGVGRPRHVGDALPTLMLVVRRRRRGGADLVSVAQGLLKSSIERVPYLDRLVGSWSSNPPPLLLGRT